MPEKSNDNALELSLSDLVQFLKKYLVLLIASPIAFAIIGICYSFLLTRLYTAQTILLPEYSMAKNNSFFSMALGGERTGAEKLVPDLYPNILSSTPFGQYLLEQPVTDETGRSYKNFKTYLISSSKPGFLAKVMSIFSSEKKGEEAKNTGKSTLPKDVLVLSSDEMGMIQSAKGVIQTTVDSKDGIITLGCEMKDPVVAAILVELSKDYLVNYVEDYRTSKMQDQVSFLEQRVIEAKSKQQSAEYALQSYRDRNRNTFLNVARIEEQRLQSDFTLAQTIYSDLVSRLEQARVRVKEEKPVFKVLEPVKIPLAKSSPKRFTIGFIFGVFGVFITLFYIIFFKERYHLRILN